MVALIHQADPRQQALAIGDGLAARRLAHVHRRLDNVFDGGQVRKKVETLEDHADLGALAGDIPLRFLV